MALLHSCCCSLTLEFRCRDIKTPNILLTAEGVAKIADVGLAKVMTNDDQQSWESTAGTFAYAAPELIIGTRCNEMVPKPYAICTQHNLIRLRCGLWCKQAKADSVHRRGAYSASVQCIASCSRVASSERLLIVMIDLLVYYNTLPL